MTALATMTHASKKNRLQHIIAEKSFKRGHFILASGLTSDHFFDLKPTLLDPEGANLTADLVLEKIALDVDAIGGLELGACPIVSSVCVKSYLASRPLRSFYVRKAKKERGTKQQIEGCSLKKGDKVVIVEDVTTKGGSVMEAIHAVRAEGAEIVKVLCILDRLQGAQENLSREGIALDYIFTKDDFMK